MHKDIYLYTYIYIYVVPSCVEVDIMGFSKNQASIIVIRRFETECLNVFGSINQAETLFYYSVIVFYTIFEGYKTKKLQS